MKALLVAVLPVLSALALALPGAVPAAGRDHSGAVTRWISVDLAEIAAHRTNPPRAARGLALLSVAIDDASRVPRKHRRAAIAGAATTVLTYLYPDRAGALEALAADERPQVALEWGRGLGARHVAYARTDGSDEVWQGTVPIGPWALCADAARFRAAARAPRGDVADLEHLVGLALQARSTSGIRQQAVRAGGSRGLRRLTGPHH
jgi:hypothetical protein